jgi:hypothetical protein
VSASWGSFSTRASFRGFRAGRSLRAAAKLHCALLHTVGGCRRAKNDQRGAWIGLAGAALALAAVARRDVVPTRSYKRKARRSGLVRSGYPTTSYHLLSVVNRRVTCAAAALLDLGGSAGGGAFEVGDLGGFSASVRSSRNSCFACSFAR